MDIPLSSCNFWNSEILFFLFVFFWKGITLHPLNSWIFFASSGFLLALTIASSVHILNPPSKKQLCVVPNKNGLRRFVPLSVFLITFDSLPESLPANSKTCQNWDSPWRQQLTQQTTDTLHFQVANFNRLHVPSESLNLYVRLCTYSSIAHRRWWITFISYVRLFGRRCVYILRLECLVHTCKPVTCWNSSRTLKRKVRNTYSRTVVRKLVQFCVDVK